MSEVKTETVKVWKNTRGLEKLELDKMPIKEGDVLQFWIMEKNEVTGKVLMADYYKENGIHVNAEGVYLAEVWSLRVMTNEAQVFYKNGGMDSLDGSNRKILIGHYRPKN